MSESEEFYTLTELYIDEEWRTIEEFPRYQVSNYGRVKSKVGQEKILKPFDTHRGYLSVRLSKEPTAKGEYKQSDIKVHRLVAQYFCGGYAKDKQVHHIDRNRQNNYYKNLLWISKEEHSKIHRELNKLDKERAAAADQAAAF